MVADVFKALVRAPAGFQAWTLNRHGDLTWSSDVLNMDCTAYASLTVDLQMAFEAANLEIFDGFCRAHCDS